MRVALFGGTFDPPHKGHIAVAKAAREQFRLDRVMFVPAAQPPHKVGMKSITPWATRYALVECAIEDSGERAFLPSDLESPERVEREQASGGKAAQTPPRPNYSIDTIRRFKKERARTKAGGSDDELFFIIGMDQLASFGRWREPEGILREAQLIVATRPGWSYEAAVKALPPHIRDNQKLMGHIHVLDGVYEDITSTRLRIGTRSGKFAREWLSPSVMERIRKEKLYRTGGEGLRNEELGNEDLQSKQPERSAVQPERESPPRLMSNSSLRAQISTAVTACENKKAENLAILQMDKNSGAFTDYFIICSGTNPKQIQAIADEVELKLKYDNGVYANSVEGYKVAEWILMDYVDFVVHVFSEASRKFYDLERLWKSAKQISLADLKERVSRARTTPVPTEKRKSGRVTPAKTAAIRKSMQAATGSSRSKPKKAGAKKSASKPKRNVTPQSAKKKKSGAKGRKKK